MTILKKPLIFVMGCPSKLFFLKRKYLTTGKEEYQKQTPKEMPFHLKPEIHLFGE
jgi:hypothetical protein